MHLANGHTTFSRMYIMLVVSVFLSEISNNCHKMLRTITLHLSLISAWTDFRFPGIVRRYVIRNIRRRRKLFGQADRRLPIFLPFWATKHAWLKEVACVWNDSPSEISGPQIQENSKICCMQLGLSVRDVVIVCSFKEQEELCNLLRWKHGCFTVKWIMIWCPQ